MCNKTFAKISFTIEELISTHSKIEYGIKGVLYSQRPKNKVLGKSVFLHLFLGRNEQKAHYAIFTRL